MSGPYRASAATIDITPPERFPLGGYILRSGVSAGILDPLRGRLLFIDSGDGALLLIALDWIYVDGRWAAPVREAAARALGIESRSVIVTATHTHSGPGIFRSSSADARQEADYLAGVSEAIVRAVGGLTATREATLLLGSSRVAGLGAHRGDPARAVDDELSVLTLKSRDGVLGRVIVYGCHPTILGPENLAFSADWAGRGLGEVDRALGGTSLFLNGAAGDVSTRFVRRGRDERELKRLAMIFADAVGRAESVQTPLEGNGIATRTASVPVGYRSLPGEEEVRRELLAVEHEIGEARSKGTSAGDVRRLESVREGAIVMLFLASVGGLEKLLGEREMNASVTLVRVGSFGIVFFPGEVMSQTALSLKAAARCRLAVCGYANDYFGYLNSAEGGYEASMAFLSSTSIEAMVDAARRLVGDEC